MTRTPSAIDAIAEDHVAAIARLNPAARTALGLPGDPAELPDYSPAGLAADQEERGRVLAALEGTDPVDEVDRITVSAMRERLGVESDLYETGELHASLNVIHSPAQITRDLFDLMPSDSPEDWAVIAERLHAVPSALQGYARSLREAADRGLIAAERQIDAVAAQCDALAGDSSFFVSLAERGAAAEGRASANALRAGAESARGAYGALAAVLRRELAPVAPGADGVGRERYALHSRSFLGAEVDLDETYEWGREELARVVAEQEAVAADLYGAGTTPEEAMKRLDAEPVRVLHGTEALREWMQRTADEAIEALAGSQFDIPGPVRALECCIAPTQTGGIYYTGPTDDFSRPGRMWWSVPAGVEEFGTWREKTTVYHEGVPGHHLQIAQTVYRREDLNSWRRLISWVSGHGEGWALYAERLMADLGFLDDPGDRMGMLDAQRLRSARVVLDIGVHLGKPAPRELGGGTWDAEKARTFLYANANMAPGFLDFELDRYLGWPGQAPSYKVGQRLWEEIREETAAREGAAFDLRAFHRRALDLGSVGLSVLAEGMRR
ncbi:DUF885 domain-containing protein [Serinibacter salmoneus]|uniref:Uncharacterized protein (DUF885 family) n=1 Tax=Serinibacter salmoneus TaxID=556530 RepID=A0A2A9D3G1_9MICO|nr:DUF885 domain-containing protein [Serinibacter salmoneus]PFG20380.1 uncharacterized protein (DUF885 family) [Serinibacter salmoneus]